jgi:16S rRNA (adenine1518-N6/adenine1519-N6)-dimethyltransferase
MDILKKTLDICRRHGIRPNKRRGQNFLVNDEVYEFMVEEGKVGSGDQVLEIGPGLGFLTAKLADRAEKVLTVEIDHKLTEILKNDSPIAGVKKVNILNQDILDLEPADFFPDRGYKIIANIPYNITSIFMRKFLEAKAKPSEMVLMVQREVAERIAAEPGKMSLLSVSVQFYASAAIARFVPRTDFYPEPEVDSAVLKIVLKGNDHLADEKSFFRMVKIGFSARRKMLQKNLANGYHIEQKKAADLLRMAGFDEKARAQDLSVNDWLRLFAYLRPL